MVERNAEQTGVLGMKKLPMSLPKAQYLKNKTKTTFMYVWQVLKDVSLWHV